MAPRCIAFELFGCAAAAEEGKASAPAAQTRQQEPENETETEDASARQRVRHCLQNKQIFQNSYVGPPASQGAVPLPICLFSVIRYCLLWQVAPGPLLMSWEVVPDWAIDMLPAAVPAAAAAAAAAALAPQLPRRRRPLELLPPQPRCRPPASPGPLQPPLPLLSQLWPPWRRRRFRPQTRHCKDKVGAGHSLQT